MSFCMQLQLVTSKNRLCLLNWVSLDQRYTRPVYDGWNIIWSESSLYDDWYKAACPSFCANRHENMTKSVWNFQSNELTLYIVSCSTMCFLVQGGSNRCSSHLLSLPHHPFIRHMWQCLPLVFSDWTAVGQSQIKRTQMRGEELACRLQNFS